MNSEQVPARGKCLVVEDSPFQGKLCKKAVESLGYECKLVVNGSEALRVLSTDRTVDLVLSDINMPGMSGLQLLAQTKQINGLEDMPFIMCTSQSDRTTVIQAAQLGCKAFLRKPYTLNSLREKLEEVFKEEQPPLERLMIVESNPADCRALRKAVEKVSSALKITDYNSAEAAKKAMDVDHPELVLVSQELPDSSGHSFIGWMKKKSACKDVPVVILSGPVSQDHVARSYELGACCHLLKSLNHDEIATALANLGVFWREASSSLAK